MGNRVEDLETQVAELQAAVDGLTEELVETKERLSQLERATEVPREGSGRDSNAEFVPNASATAEAAEASDEASEGADAADAADADAEGDEDGESQETDDIIVA